MRKFLVVFCCAWLLCSCVSARATKDVSTASMTASSNILHNKTNDFSAKTEEPAKYTKAIAQSTQLNSAVISPSVSIWELTTGSLYGQLDIWAIKAGYQLVWKSENDLHMMSNATFKGTFIEAVESLFGGLAKLGHSFTVTFYTGNSVLEVKED